MRTLPQPAAGLADGRGTHCPGQEDADELLHPEGGGEEVEDRVEEQVEARRAGRQEGPPPPVVVLWGHKPGEGQGDEIRGGAGVHATG